jgi:hypothetical protein
MVIKVSTIVALKSSSLLNGPGYLVRDIARINYMICVRIRTKLC